MAKKFLSLLMMFVLICSISYADVVDLMFGHNGPTPVFYGFSWFICCTFFFIIIWCILKILKKDRKKILKAYIIMLVIVPIICIIISIPVAIYNKNHYYPNYYKNTLSRIEISAYNRRYEQYGGTNRTLYEARSLINMVNAHNSNIEEKAIYGEFIISGDYTTTEEIQNRNYYSIIDFIYNESGIVIGCTIEQQDDFVHTNN